eukprot:Phypoly_transcript_10412.p1 GENE.Phypoly_transcript_10412~~Phypoly_transcript_10412.p1  ORF type:complete len:313 (+),score=26.92 Phypoly_transcript_10412:216-1154(+)
MSHSSLLCSRCSGTMLASARFVNRVGCSLFRSGNATSPQLSKLRPMEAVPFTKEESHVMPPPYDNLWGLQQFPGISTYDRPFWTSGRLWVYQENYAIPEGLCVYHNHSATLGIDELGFKRKIRHFSWLPQDTMVAAKYSELLALAESKLVPPEALLTKDAWVLLPKGHIPPKHEQFNIVPASIQQTSRNVLHAMQAAIVQLETRAEELGETDEALHLCDVAMYYRNWYYMYLDGLADAYSQSIPTLNFSVDTWSKPITIVERTRRIPAMFLPIFREYIEKKPTSTDKIMNEANKDQIVYFTYERRKNEAQVS